MSYVVGYAVVYFLCSTARLKVVIWNFMSFNSLLVKVSSFPWLHLFLIEIRNKQILINLVAQLMFLWSKIFPFSWCVVFVCVFIVCFCFVLFLLIEESEPEQDTKGIFFSFCPASFKCLVLFNCLVLLTL